MKEKFKKLLKSLGFSLLSIVYLVLLSVGYPFLVNLVSLPNIVKGILFYALLIIGLTILFKIAIGKDEKQTI